MKPMSEAHFAILRRHMVDVIGIQVDLASEELGKAALPTQREFSPHARAKKLARAAKCPVYSLTPSGVLAENHPKNRGFVGVLRGQKCLRRGQKCLRRRFFTAISRWRVVSRRALDASGF